MQLDPKYLSELDDLTEEQLDFSALSEGLGLTRAPKASLQKQAIEPKENVEEKKKELSLSGLGAVSAGPARPAPAPATNKNIAKPAAQNTNIKNPLSEPAAPQWLRAAAFFLDSTFIALPLFAAWRMSFGAEALAIFRSDWAALLTLFSAIFATYFLLSESFGGQSPAKMILGLQVVEDDKYQKPTGFKHALSRMALLVIGIALGGIGLWASLADFKRRPWHDRFSGSIVRKKN